MKKGKGDCCGFCEHWKLHHKNNFSDLSNVKIYFLDTTDEPGTQEDGYQALRTLEDQLDDSEGQSLSFRLQPRLQ